MYETEWRPAYTTPKSFLSNLSLFKSLLDQQRESLTADIRRLTNGLKKLKETVRGGVPWSLSAMGGGGLGKGDR